MTKRDARVEAAGIIGLDLFRQLGEAGLTVVWKDDLEKMKKQDEFTQMIVRWAQKKMAEEVREEDED